MATSFTRNGKSEGRKAPAKRSGDNGKRTNGKREVGRERGRERERGGELEGGVRCYYVRSLRPNEVVTLRKLRQLLTRKQRKRFHLVE